jgi:nucleotide-binding universal stress UspA family protein
VVEPHLPTSLETAIPKTVVRQLWEEAERSADTILRGFSETARLEGVAVETLKFEAVAGRVADAVSRLARCFDATILQQPDPAGVATFDILEATLFGSGRPLLIVPYIHRTPKLKCVLVAWDGGATAARAVADSLPLLALASEVHIVTSPGRRGEDRLISSDVVARHLGRHGIKAVPKSLPDTASEVAPMLLSDAADAGADLIVMGGYGHSRMRELVLGGTTREILRSMTVPVLMSH